MPARSSEDVFVSKVERYDALVDWSSRLAHEEPFFRRLFDKHQVRSILDTACGTGRHAIMFHGWSLTVEGADVSEDMIHHCQRQLPASETLRWVVRSFDERCDQPGSFDATICVGNSLALAEKSEIAHRAIGAMVDALRSGGVCVIQVQNLWSIPEGPTVWRTCKRATVDGQDHIILKGIHRVQNRAYVDLIDLILTEDGFENQTSDRFILGMDADDLTRVARESGAVDISLYGDYDDSPYNRDHSRDIIMVCQKK